MQSVSLEQIIREQLMLTGSSNDWYPVLCKVCNDHGKKGNRAGFRFDNGGVVGYHCFNCGHKAKFDPSQRGRHGQILLSKAMVQVLRDFGISEDSYKGIYLAALTHESDQGGHQNVATPISSIEPKELPLPSPFYFLKDAPPTDKWALIATDYLEQRLVDPASYPFMLSSAMKTGRKEIDKWRGRLIIPIYKDKKLVYYQGRALSDAQKKYESPSDAKDKVLYGFDKLFLQTETPLFVMEGFFDAFLIDGVALLGNRISPEQAQWLNRSKRKKIYIPDRYGNGQLGAHDALKQKWSISTPDWGDAKDVNDAIIKYGKIYVLTTIMEQSCEGKLAETKLGLYCEQESSKKEVEKSSSTKRRTKQF